jgi:hypothetical protein
LWGRHGLPRLNSGGGAALLELGLLVGLHNDIKVSRPALVAVLDDPGGVFVSRSHISVSR